MINNLRNRDNAENKVPAIVKKVTQINTNYSTNNVTNNINLQAKVNVEPVKPKKQYSAFPFKQEIPFIEFHAKRVGIEPELLMAVRMAENGGRGKEYGILTSGSGRKAYDNDKGYEYNGQFYNYRIGSEKQMAWSARTLANALGDFDVEKRNGKFRGDKLDYLQKRYAPSKAINDPRGLNGNWKGNVNRAYLKVKNSN